LSKKNINYDIFVWASDFEEYRGEGRLARVFIQKISKNLNSSFFVKTPGSSYLVNKKKIFNLKKKNFNLNFFNKYIIFVYGIFLVWINYIKGKKVIYLNYLPLWNFLIFILLPSKTVLGPITGGSFYLNVSLFQKFIRKYLFPIFYFISLKTIHYKFERAIFSTELLKKFISKKYKKYFTFNACLLSYNDFQNRNSDKKIDFLIYYKDHYTKNPFYLRKIIYELKKLNFLIVIVGDKILSNKTHSFIARKKLLSLLKKTKFSIISGENFYSLFCLDCISCGVKVFFDSRIEPNKYFFNKKNFLTLNFDNINESIKKINSFVNLNNYFIRDLKNDNFFTELSKIDLFIKDFLIKKL
jgi:hypothetical protein